MLISLNWLKGGLQTDNITDEELVKLIGARLVEVEGVIDQTHKYDKIYAVQVKYCEAIEGTHLHLCKIDDGGKADNVERDKDGYVQVMCGAPNVHEGMMAAWVAPGAIVPQTFNTDEPFEIGMRKMLKQYDSYGMLGGADELDLATTIPASSSSILQLLSRARLFLSSSVISTIRFSTLKTNHLRIAQILLAFLASAVKLLAFLVRNIFPTIGIPIQLRTSRTIRTLSSILLSTKNFVLAIPQSCSSRFPKTRIHISILMRLCSRVQACVQSIQLSTQPTS